MARKQKAAPASAKSEEPTKEDATAGADGLKGTASTGGTEGRATSVWKSVLGATGLYCERQTLYRETRRLPNGYRLDIPPTERITYGTALDAAHAAIMRARIEHGPVDAQNASYEACMAEVESGVAAGMSVAKGRGTDAPMTDADWKAMATSVGLALEKLLGVFPNRVRELKSGRVIDPEPEGTPPGPPVTWIPVSGSDGERLSLQGLDGATLRTNTVEGVQVAGKPDYLWLDKDGTILGWWDLKSGERGRSFPKQWAAAEVVAYDLMVADANGGVLPEFHGYLEYHRTAKPFWSVNTAPVHPSTLTLAREYMRRWARALTDPDPRAVSFSVSMCGKCEWREPIPEVDHPGCEVGQAVLDVAPVTEEPADA